MKKKRSLLLVLPVLAFPVVASATYYNILHELSHECGSVAGPSSWIGDGSCLGKFMTYGPYVTTLPAGDNLAVSTFNATAYGSPVDLSWDFEVYDGVTDSVRATKTFLQSNAAGAQPTLYEPVLPFQVAPNHNIQIRTRHHGGGFLEQCGVQILTEPGNKVLDLAPATQQQHQVGETYGGTTIWRAWDGMPGCANGSCRGRFFTYGPYGSLPSLNGARFAQFTLSWEPLAGSDPGWDEVIATVDVMAYVGGVYTVLASRPIVRREFNVGNMVPTVFPIKFRTRGSYSQFQYRVKWQGKGLIYHFATKVYDPSDQTCL